MSRGVVVGITWRLGMVLVRFLHHMLSREVVATVTARDFDDNLRRILVGRSYMYDR